MSALRRRQKAFLPSQMADVCLEKTCAPRPRLHFPPSRLPRSGAHLLPNEVLAGVELLD